MILPEFPNFKDIDLFSRDTVRDYLYRFPLEASEYTFTNLFAFRETYDIRLSLLRDNLIILKNAEPVSMFCPVGSADILDVMDEIFDYLKNVTDEPFIERIPEGFLRAYLKNGVKFIIEEERNHFDYVYDVRELIDLKGRKYHDKKNKVNKFRSLYKYEYIALTPDLIGECLEFEDYWCEVRDCGKYPGLNRERCAILEMLNNFSALNIKGGVIRMDGKIAALTLGEKYLHDTFVIHVEKANTRIPGLYQVINQEFLIHEANDCRFVNREQDLGVQGLKYSKMSYNPVRFIKKYKVQKRLER
jgi:hypothetical protein